MQYTTSVFILILCLPLCLLFSQTSLSGVVNVYDQLADQDECTNSITLTNAADFSPGMGILLMQMTGATINLSNSESYGDITDLNGCGAYEYNRILEITGNEVSLELTLQRTYTPSLTQVVGFEIHEDAAVNSLVSPTPWNGSTGGIVAIEVNGTLTLNADLDASGAGFAGGVPFSINNNNCNFLTNANNYAYDANNWRGAPKGNGIGRASTAEPHGRGAQANGGGGGNDHNSGGGGGGLYTAGGAGGTNDEPSTFGCDGDYPGRGGKALSAAGGLLFLGGGGGSGHANNDDPSGGGNGGGIIIVKAGNIVFNGGNLRSNGLAAQGITGDGGGGGGAGGNIILLAENLSGSTAISAQGGAGASVDNNNRERCFGPGGGGSGGAFWTNQAVTANLAGGAAGQSFNSISCPDDSNGAEAGTTGLSFELANLAQGEAFELPMITQLSADTIVCVSDIINLTATINDPSASVQWQRFDGSAWQSLTDTPGVYSGTSTTELTINASPPTAGFYRITLSPNSNCFDAIPSAQILLTVLDQAAATPSFSVDGLTANFQANLTNGNVVQWTFEPSQTSTTENPSYTFPAGGTYPVQLTIANACGAQMYELLVTVAEPITVLAEASSQEGCAPLVVIFEDLTEGTVTERNWSFPGGDPATSTASNPVVTFMDPGTYEVTLEVGNGSSSDNTTISIEVFVPPVPAFSVTSDGLTINLQNTSSNASSFVWNFGDGSTSNEENPTHTYATAGTYEITLNASNDRCAVATGQTFTVGTTSTSTALETPVRFFPNPVSDVLQVENWKNGTIQLYNMNGQVLTIWSSPSRTLDLSQIPAGAYVLAILVGENPQYEILIVQ